MRPNHSFSASSVIRALRPACIVALPLMAVLLLSACSTTSGTVSTPGNSNNPNGPLTSGQQLPTPTNSSADATPTPLPPPPSSASDCSQVPGFSGAGSASAGGSFGDVSFPSGSVSTTGSAFTDVYAFQIINVCTTGSDAGGVQSFFNSSLPGNGWSQSTTYPYHGNPGSNCGDPYCWRKASGSNVRYVSLENVNGTGSLVVYSLRLATAPTPTFNMAVRYNSQDVPQGTTVTVTANCGSGEQMVGGGYWIDDSNQIYEPGESYPSSANAWTTAIQNNSPQAMTLWSYVECIQANFPLNIQIISNALSLPTGGMLPVVAQCPSSTVATGGGFRTSDPSGLTGWVVTSTPGEDFNHNAWTVNAQAKFGALTETSYVLCASANAVSSRVSYTAIGSIGPSSGSEQLPDCNSGEFATDGGFTYNLGSQGEVFYYGSAPSKYPTEWITAYYNRDGSSSHNIEGGTFCVTPNPTF